MFVSFLYQDNLFILAHSKTRRKEVFEKRMNNDREIEWKLYHDKLQRVQNDTKKNKRIALRISKYLQ